MLMNFLLLQVSLLVQAIPVGGEEKNQTNDTNLVDWDETLIIVDIIVSWNKNQRVYSLITYVVLIVRLIIHKWVILHYFIALHSSK